MDDSAWFSPFNHILCILYITANHFSQHIIGFIIPNFQVKPCRDLKLELEIIHHRKQLVSFILLNSMWLRAGTALKNCPYWCVKGHSYL